MTHIDKHKLQPENFYMVFFGHHDHSGGELYIFKAKEGSTDADTYIQAIEYKEYNTSMSWDTYLNHQVCENGYNISDEHEEHRTIQYYQLTDEEVLLYITLEVV